MALASLTMHAMANMRFIMTDKPIDLDQHRGIAAQQATELRRLDPEVEARRAALHARREEMEEHLLAAPAETWLQAANKARYLPGLYAASAAGGDARTRMLVAAVLEDFDRLSSTS
jgi:hypothetical protein